MGQQLCQWSRNAAKNERAEGLRSVARSEQVLLNNAHMGFEDPVSPARLRPEEGAASLADGAKELTEEDVTRAVEMATSEFLDRGETLAAWPASPSSGGPRLPGPLFTEDTWPSKNEPASPAPPLVPNDPLAASPQPRVVTPERSVSQFAAEAQAQQPNPRRREQDKPALPIEKLFKVQQELVVKIQEQDAQIRRILESVSPDPKALQTESPEPKLDKDYARQRIA
eukprot:gnl/TRDRNA2_/TRDRNA2_191535_c0_seq1.p1 gnl/TRDRNA2_/TRDRNA2_191535_c0~~gnl/TRDRNA2_/TRDRNA2_191535_c0_seq1.p1  ORF type:complete len:226 (+),score=43.40 gnl/TRDRNA2_/TRDRNA2_191535_c0_seq1:86-763(+)